MELGTQNRENKALSPLFSNLRASEGFAMDWFGENQRGESKKWNIHAEEYPSFFLFFFPQVIIWACLRAALRDKRKVPVPCTCQFSGTAATTSVTVAAGEELKSHMEKQTCRRPAAQHVNAVLSHRCLPLMQAWVVKTEGRATSAQRGFIGFYMWLITWAKGRTGGEGWSGISVDALW